MTEGITYEEWKVGLNTDGWTNIGEWAFPRKNNSSYSQVFYHWCGTVVPDGIKMVVLLTEKL